MAKQIADSQVYKATIETLLAHGYAGATTKRIAKQAGINEVTLFRKYGSKAKLVAAAVAHERIQLAAQEIVYTGDVVADLLSMVQIYHNATPHHSQLFALIIAEIVRYPELRETLRVPHQMIEKFGSLMARYQQEGKLRKGEPILIVGALLAPVIIDTMLRSADPDFPVPPLDLRLHVERFLGGYRL
jgi:AcrR family transcriptional regulator